MIHNFVGIDISKNDFVVACYNKKTTNEYKNSTEGINEFIEEYQCVLQESLSILETTGGYEAELLYSLCQHGFRVHRANTRKVKNFIRSLGNAAKTDILDAKALARYGQERHKELELFKPQSEQAINLFQLVQRRNDLKQMKVAEKNRRREKNNTVQSSIEKFISLLEEEINNITKEIRDIIKSDPVLEKKLKVIKTVPGIGDIVASELLVLLPEIGKLDRRKIASLAGLAPRANDSGRFKGYRKTCPGRCGIKQILYMAAMAARNSNSELKIFYQNLINRGKKKMVALVALMRKILVIANARLKTI